MSHISALQLPYQLAFCFAHFFETSQYKNCKVNVCDEGEEYAACDLEFSAVKMAYREAKRTPKKKGQIVTFWKREVDGIRPFTTKDDCDYFLVLVKEQDKVGVFFFPKAVLVQKRIVSTEEKEGKRAFRLYPPWETELNKQAKTSQKWQLQYWYEMGSQLDF